MRHHSYRTVELLAVAQNPSSQLGGDHPSVTAKRGHDSPVWEGETGESELVHCEAETLMAKLTEHMDKQGLPGKILSSCDQRQAA